MADASIENTTIDIQENSFTADHIEVYYATEKQKKEVIAHLSDRLKGKVHQVYRVINQKHKKRFNDYLKKEDIHLKPLTPGEVAPSGDGEGLFSVLGGRTQFIPTMLQPRTTP